MKSDILDKIEKTLNKGIDGEADVVYLLTRVYKILELEGLKGREPLLCMYRNWSVHAEVCYDKEARDYLTRFVKNPNQKEYLLSHQELIEKFNSILAKYNLSEMKGKQQKNFLYHLNHVLADTPLKYKIGGSDYQFYIDPPVKDQITSSYKLSVTVYPKPLKFNMSIPSVKAVAQEK